MSTQIVQHKSRDLIYDITFANGESNLSKNITSETAGKIYEVITTNVSSYTVSSTQQGSSSNINVNNQYQLTKDLSFNVSVTKIIPGDAATIKIISRRDATTTNAFNVPSLSKGAGDYIYALKNDMTVDKISATTFLVVSTITLPVLPAGASYFFMAIDKDTNKVFVFGQQATNKTTYATVIKHDDTIWDFDETQQDTYTQIYTRYASATFWSGGHVYNQFLNTVFLQNTPYGGGRTALRINLTDKSITLLDFGTPYADFLNGVYMRINPVCSVYDYSEMLGGAGYSVDYETYFVKSVLKETTANSRSEYISSIDKTSPGSSTGFARFYDYKTQVNDLNISPSGITGGSQVDRLYIRELNKMIVNANGGTVNTYSIFEFDTFTAVGYQMASPPVSQSYLNAPVFVRAAGKFCCKGSGNNALYLINPNDGTYVSLLLSSNIIYHACNCLQH